MITCKSLRKLTPTERDEFFSLFYRFPISEGASLTFFHDNKITPRAFDVLIAWNDDTIEKDVRTTFKDSKLLKKFGGMFEIIK